jgi:lysophospholipase L1-like esterase
MVQAQREVAFEEGCAFFDAVAAMGGPGSIRAWLKRSPRLAEPDLKHLNHRGRDRMGEMIYAALVERYRERGS